MGSVILIQREEEKVITKPMYACTQSIHHIQTLHRMRILASSTYVTVVETAKVLYYSQGGTA